jgi:hypothetical protein
MVSLFNPMAVTVRGMRHSSDGVHMATLVRQ